MTNAVASRNQTPEEQERRQGLWWYVLAGGLLALVGELSLANRRHRLG